MRLRRRDRVACPESLSAPPSSMIWSTVGVGWKLCFRLESGGRGSCISPSRFRTAGCLVPLPSPKLIMPREERSMAKRQSAFTSRAVPKSSSSTKCRSATPGPGQVASPPHGDRRQLRGCLPALGPLPDAAAGGRRQTRPARGWSMPSVRNVTELKKKATRVAYTGPPCPDPIATCASFPADRLVKLPRGPSATNRRPR